MFTTIRSFTPIHNQKSLVKTGSLNAGIPGFIPKRNQTFLTLHSPFCLLSLKILKLNGYPEYSGIY